jgi:mycothiol synthase
MTWRDDLAGDAVDSVRELLLAVREEDGRTDVTPGGPLPGEFRGGRHLLATEGTLLVGYAHLDQAGDAFGRQVGELLVHPGARGHGIGTALLTELLAQVGAPAEPPTELAEQTGERLRIWSHTDHPGAARLARRFGLRRVRELVRMRLALDSVTLARPSWPAGVSVRPFVPGKDEHAVIEVNRRAFSWHPEQGALTVAELMEIEGEGWFDPAGFFLAVDKDDRLLGFHWTKVHPDGVGEVYVVGVDPAAQGGGLGKALTLIGLWHLADRGTKQIILYVEGDNAPALAVYTKLGFARWDAGVQYAI